MKSLTREAMEARVARFDKLQTYQRQNFEANGIPAGAVEKITARRGAAPLVIRRRHDGINAPVKGPRGLIVSIAECEPGNGPGLHRHLNTVENFMCLSGRFEIAWGAGYDRAGKVTRRAIRFLCAESRQRNRERLRQRRVQKIGFKFEDEPAS